MFSTHLSAARKSLLGLLIDPTYYSARAAADVDGGTGIVDRYLTRTSEEYVDPSSTFSAERYYARVPGLHASGEDPYLHYLFDEVGEEALTTALGSLTAASAGMLHAVFDAVWYRRNYPDVEAGGGDLLVHYLIWGWHEGRDPSLLFSTTSYLDRYPDVRSAGVSPLLHWLMHGIAEGRVAFPAAAGLLDGWEGLSSVQQALFAWMAGSSRFGADGATVEPRDLASRSDGWDIAPSFNAAKFLATNPRFRTNGRVPLLHYLFDLVGEAALSNLFVGRAPGIIEAARGHFDASWYLYSYPDVEASGQDAFIHYMTIGWRERRDPSADFSTKLYLLRYADIVVADVNPFLHWIEYGRSEKRSGTSSANTFRNRPYAPSVTAVLVNTKADPLTPDCIAAVARQSYAKLDIIVVGASLADAELRALRTARGSGDRDVQHLPGDASPPALWALLEEAVTRTAGDLAWFVEPSSVHDFEFLARLLSSFADQSVQLGFGRRLGPEDLDYHVDERELARQMKGWTRHVPTPAARWFPDHLNLAELAAPPQSFLWRRRRLDPQVWQQARGYDRLGFCFLHLHIASGGQVASVRDAVERLPPQTPVDAHVDDALRSEAVRLAADVQAFWPTSIEAQLPYAKTGGTKWHVLIVTHGIFAGGAENLPIQMANALVERGIIVSMLLFKIDLNPEMRATLHSSVSIYEGDWVIEYGCDRFIRDIGCTLIHSHGVVGEMFFFRLCEKPLPIPYVATLHGSYEASSRTELPDRLLEEIVRKVDLFIYTADKNLAPILRCGVAPDKLMKMINAMPIDRAPFPQTRAALGIAEDAIVFTFVARGIAEKGWTTAIGAFKDVQRRHPERSMHLCLVGEGEETDRLYPHHVGDPSISFLGFQLRIHGLYRMSDVAIVPTRFAGESFPLCIIQALQEAVPVIATDVGEIASMLEEDGVAAGMVVEPDADDQQFQTGFAAVMDCLVDDERRTLLSTGARKLSEKYDMASFIDKYINVYKEVSDRFNETTLPLLHTRINEAEIV